MTTSTTDALEAVVQTYLDARRAHQECINSYIAARAAWDAEYEALIATRDPDSLISGDERKDEHTGG